MRIEINENIYLDEVRTSDGPAYLEYFSEKEIYDHTLRIPFPYTQKDFDAWMKLCEEQNTRARHLTQWAIRNRDGILMGGIGFVEFVPNHKAEIGYWLAKKFWGHGVMTQVVNAFCEFSRKKFGIVRFIGHVFAHNPRSARVLEKCGFTLEGNLRKHYKKAGQIFDGKLYARIE